MNLRVHHYIIETGAEDATNHLSGEGAFWREFSLLGKLEIPKEILALLQRIEGICEKVHVRLESDQPSP